MGFSTAVLKSAVVATLLTVASHANAIGTASNPVSLGLLGNEDTHFGNTFSNTSNFTDYYSFSIAGGSNGAAGSTFDTAWNFFLTGVDVTSITLSGGSLSTVLVDNSPGSFIFTGLGAGTYTMAVSGNSTWGIFSSSYNGTIHAITTASPTAPVASPAPEPADFAMALVGLAGVGFMVRRSRAAR